jgi:hypothetical protein
MLDNRCGVQENKTPQLISLLLPSLLTSKRVEQPAIILTYSSLEKLNSAHHKTSHGIKVIIIHAAEDDDEHTYYGIIFPNMDVLQLMIWDRGFTIVSF